MSIKYGESVMKKLYVCDFDGTIYKENEKRHFDAVLKEFSRLSSEGNEVVVATGRPLHLLEPFFEDFENTFFISNDGALFSKGFEIILENPIDKEKLKKKTEKTKNSFVAYGESITYARYSEKSLGMNLNRFYRGHVVRVCGIDEISENIYKVGFFGTEECDFLEKCWSSYGVSEYTAKGVSKGECLKKVMDLLGFSAENTVVAGDGVNDISMMKLAGKSYAMVDASPVVKASADQVVSDILNVLRGDLI